MNDNEPYGRLSAIIDTAVMRALRMESTKRKNDGEDPQTQASIIEAALREWLIKHGRMKHRF